MTKFSGLKTMRRERQKAAEIPVPGHTVSETPEVPIQPRRVGRPAGKRSNPEYQQVTLLLHRDHYLEARKRLIDEKKDVSDVLNELLTDWLKL